MRILLLALALAAAACGSGGGPAAPSGPAPFSQTITGNVGVFGTTFHPLVTPRAGNMTLRLNWQGSVDLDLFLSGSGCGSLYPKNACGIVAAADGVANPEVVARTVAAGESYRIWIDNLSLSQSMNYTLSITIE